MIFHRVAEAVAWLAGVGMLACGGFVWLMTTDVWINATNNPENGTYVGPSVLIQVMPAIALVLGFLTVVAAMCGGFRRQMR